jgi:hypothetical protein
MKSKGLIYMAELFKCRFAGQGKSVLRLFAPSFPRSLSRTSIRERESIGRKALIS